MKKPRFSPQARQDPQGIIDFIAADNPSAANRFLVKVRQTCELLARLPGIGRARSDLAADLRSFVVGNYLIFYRPIETTIEIVRVLHGARDIYRIFRPESRDDGNGESHETSDPT